MRTLTARRRALIPALLLAFVIAAALCLTVLTWAPHEAKAQTATLLHWRPPTLTSPTTKTVPATDTSFGNGITKLSLDQTKDYIVKLPSTSCKKGGLEIQGGRNVLIKGGCISANPNRATNDTELKALYFNNNKGTVHVEGVLIDGAITGGQQDGIQVGPSMNSSTIQVENNRIVNLTGRSDQTHADVIQLTGSVGALRVDHLTGSSNYQGLQYAQFGYHTTLNTNIYSAGYVAGTYAGKYLAFMNDGPDCGSEGGEFSGVYIVPHPGRVLGNSVHPTTTSSLTNCRAVLSADGQSVSWPTMVAPLKGVIKQGPPPNGDFVPAGVAGIGYVSPGYE